MKRTIFLNQLNKMTAGAIFYGITMGFIVCLFSWASLKFGQAHFVLIQYIGVFIGVLMSTYLLYICLKMMVIDQHDGQLAYEWMLPISRRKVYLQKTISGIVLTCLMVFSASIITFLGRQISVVSDELWHNLINFSAFGLIGLILGAGFLLFFTIGALCGGFRQSLILMLIILALLIMIMIWKFSGVSSLLIVGVTATIAVVVWFFGLIIYPSKNYKFNQREVL